MSKAFAIGLARFILGLSAVLALIWWGAMWGRASGWTPGMRAVIVAFALLQVAAWLAVGMTLRREARDTASRDGAFAAVLLTVILATGNALFWFTPVLGAPILLVTLLGSSAAFDTVTRSVSRRDGSF